MNDWKKTRKVASMPGVVHDAVTVLARTLDKAQQRHIKSVLIGIEWNDDTFTAEWSSQATSTLAMHSVVLQRKVSDECFGVETLGPGDSAA